MRQFIKQLCQFNKNKLKSYCLYSRSSTTMLPSRKGVRTNRSREDYQLFKINFPSYSPDDVSDIVLHASPGKFINNNMPIATVHLRNTLSENSQKMQDASYELTTHISGTVQIIGESFVEVQIQGEKSYHLKEGTKRGNLVIMQLRECDHLPLQESFVSGDIISQSTNKTKPTFHNVCMRCQKVLWIYYEPQELSLTIADLLKANTFIKREDLPELEWSIIVNEQFTPTVSVAKVKDEELTLPHLAKSTFLLNFQEYKNKLNDQMVVMKLRKAICEHEKLIDGRCQYCMQEIKYENVRQYESYLFQMDQQGSGGMLLKGTALAKQQEQFINGLLSSQRAIIILDLDNTILHSNEMSELQPETVMHMNDCYLIPKIQPGFDGKLRKDYIVVKMRPFFKLFLYEVSKYYQIYVYTKGTRIYAQEICNFVRAQYANQHTSHIKTWLPEKHLFLKDSKNFKIHRIISRNEDANLQSKSLERILPTKKDYHLILDDRRDVWNNSPSWYYTMEYFFFIKKIRNADLPAKPIQQLQHYQSKLTTELPELKQKLHQMYKHSQEQFPDKRKNLIEVSDRPDYYLLFAAHALTKIHRNFFDIRKKLKANSFQKSDKNQTIWFIQYRMKHFFQKQKAVFLLGKQDLLNTARRAQRLGIGTVKSEEQVPNFVIRSMSFIKQYQKSANPNQILNVLGEMMALILQIKQNINQNKSYSAELTNLMTFISKCSNSVHKQSIKEDSPVTEILTAAEKMEEEIKKKQSLQHQFLALKKFTHKKVPIVSQTWVKLCYEFNYPFNYEKFILTDPFKDEQDVTSINAMIEHVALNIKRDIQDKMEHEFKY